jgi:hypothetical protein
MPYLFHTTGADGPVRPKWDFREIGLNELPEHVQPSFWDALATTRLVGESVTGVGAVTRLVGGTHGRQVSCHVLATTKLVGSIARGAHAMRWQQHGTSL